MHQFAALFEQIDQTQSTNEKVSSIKNYFQSCSDADGAWALFFLSGNRVKRLISSRMLLEWSLDLIDLPLWIFDECYASVGDTAEMISLLLPRKEKDPGYDYSLSDWIETIILPLQKATLEEKKQKIISFWKQLSTKEVFIINKILTGSFRMGVSSLLTLKALSQAMNISREVLTQRLMGHWEPTGEFFESLRSVESNNKYLNPYPFYLAYPFEGCLEELGSISEWLIEWKWDGIRGQAVIGEQGTALWSRGNEMISEVFPELMADFKKIAPGTILDGEVLAYVDKRPLPFGELQKRLGRKKVSKAMLENIPIVFMAYDILEYNGKDIRNLPLVERRGILEGVDFTSTRIIVSQAITGLNWQDILSLRLESRERGTE